MSYNHSFHTGRFWTKRELQEVKKKKKVRGFQSWFCGPEFRKTYNIADSRDYYLAIWREYD